MTRNLQNLFISSLIVLLPLGPASLYSDATDDYDDDISFLTAEPAEEGNSLALVAESVPEQPFDPFTGKVNKNKVRLRLQPNLESPIIKELSQGDLFIVVGATDEFFAIQPPPGTKAYVFRTYVLDNTVEMNKVNVRLEPNLDSPTIAQLNIGDKVDGIVSAQNNKWLEITPPNTARFFIAKDFVENIGDSAVMAKILKRKDEVNQLLNSTYVASQTEMNKEYPEINLDGVYANLKKVINQYGEFTEQVNRAKELTTLLQDNHMQKKLAYLEAREKMTEATLASKTSEMSEQMRSQQEKLSQLEQQLSKERAARRTVGFVTDNKKALSPTASANNNVKMATWVPIEQTLYATWADQHDGRSQDDFYKDQGSQAVVLHGVIEPYTRVIKNKPGDYVLVNQSNHLPIAYLYSTMINLQDKIGQEVTIYGAPRPNNNFAFPSFFVLNLE